ncbi:hypothetical protein LLEC1_02399 [Akanthomyces lecanii]|uniref:F-box domain-containing protein n=1 Tax=Cordyceps confragosa TaxID=2714763 RepID=A0A179IC03_CORDF|nr:hypothetical protein LLEC1_02399 [Akanthomyces lecanii]
MTDRAPKVRWAEFPLEIIAMIAECLPYGRDVYYFMQVCKTYHSLLERRLYVRFAPMPVVPDAERQDSWTTARSRKTARRRAQQASSQGASDNVLMWAVEKNRKETVRKFCQYLLGDTFHLHRRRNERRALDVQGSCKAAFGEAARMGQVGMLEIFLQEAREHVEVLDVVRKNVPRPGLANVHLALKYGLDPSADPEPLIHAMGASDIEVPRLLLDRGADPNHRMDGVLSAAFCAAQREDTRFLQLLVDYGADLKQTCAISKSVSQGQPSHEEYDARMHSPVVAAACLSHNLACLKFLIDSNYFDPAGGETCNVFLERLCFMDRRRWRYRSRDEAFHRTLVRDTQRRQKFSLRLLIKRGLDPNLEVHGDSLLAWAACRGIDEIVELLLEKGATVDTLNTEDMTPLSNMLGWYDDYGYTHGYSLKSAKLLVEAGACLSNFDNSVYSPFWTSVFHEDRRLFKYLLDSLESGDNFAKSLTAQKHFQTSDEYMRATVNEGGRDGATPLLTAAELGNYFFVERLLEVGADARAADVRGRVPLHAAAERDDDKICRLLLAHGADATQKNNAGHDAFHYAKNAEWFAKLVRIENNKRAAAAKEAENPLQPEENTSEGCDRQA